MRYLATNHIFREVKPDVYANNRISSVCDTGKPVTEIISRRVPYVSNSPVHIHKNPVRRPEKKYVGTNGIAAFISHACVSSIRSFYLLYSDSIIAQMWITKALVAYLNI